MNCSVYRLYPLKSQQGTSIQNGEKSFTVTAYIQVACRYSFIQHRESIESIQLQITDVG